MKYARTESGGIVVAPHFLAAEAGARVLSEGGNAIEAMIAAAASIVVVYPHMNSLGGDNFFLIGDGGKPLAIDACGAAAKLASIDFYRDLGLEEIPSRGPMAALTVAGAVSGWQLALEESKRRGGKLPLRRLFEDAIQQAKHGTPVSGTLHRNSVAKFDELSNVPGFSEIFLTDKSPYAEGSDIVFPTLADTLEQLTLSGLDDFYCGDIARSLVKDLESVGSPLRLVDLAEHAALTVEPLSVKLKSGVAYTMPPPTQGLASMMILGMWDRLGVKEAEGFEHVHSIVEASKKAFRIRDQYVSDPNYMTVDPFNFLSDETLETLSNEIDPKHASSWPEAGPPGDTVWLGAIDSDGCSVSMIQSIYWEFGSGVVLPETGIVWQNRGTSFSLDTSNPNPLGPGRRPFHTIHPAMAVLDDGRQMVYGTMGGEGQPQTQAAIFTRYVDFGEGLEEAIAAPRWLLGRTWGEETAKLRIENRFDTGTIEALRTAGHDLEVVGGFEEMMGHAGAIVWHAGGTIEGASDPRCDGSAVTDAL
ncbi:MAG: gamma-glutamyltransferase [Rhodospirillaceae bacterium]|nr:gamma-glutamyltransferase [Rhodospirillaceae bacterium]|tara:strand:+ start:20396 stop:21988 length:1593 start_codon:yes stop_codon:yes gene_type:complete